MKHVVKDYQYWEVQIFYSSQAYLGRCVIWCKREDAIDLSGATEQEHTELLQIIRELKASIEQAFKPDWFNYAFLGNLDRHLHCHLVPRYSTKREFAGKTFIDERYGMAGLVERDFPVDDGVLREIVGEIRKYLP